MNTYNFTLLFEGPDALSPEVFDALFNAGCDDASFGAEGSAQFGEFDRDASSYAEAVISAIEDLERAAPGLLVRRVKTDDLVGVSDIAARTGYGREHIRLLAEGRRGPGSFPAAQAWIGNHRALWHWPEVVTWFHQVHKKPVDLDPHAATSAAINSAIDFRRQFRAVTHLEQNLIRKWVSSEIGSPYQTQYPSVPDRQRIASSFTERQFGMLLVGSSAHSSSVVHGTKVRALFEDIRATHQVLTQREAILNAGVFGSQNELPLVDFDPVCEASLTPATPIPLPVVKDHQLLQCVISQQASV